MSPRICYLPCVPCLYTTCAKELLRPTVGLVCLCQGLWIRTRKVLCCPRAGTRWRTFCTQRYSKVLGIANDRGTVAVEWKHHRCDRLKRRRDLSVEVSVLRGWDPKVPVGSPVSFPKRSNPAWRLVAPSSPCRINTKSKHHIYQKINGTPLSV